MNNTVLFYTMCVALAVISAPAIATGGNAFNRADFQLSQSDHGGVGLIQTPTARMQDEGYFSFNYADANEYRYWSVSIQLFDWLETTARYADVRTQLYSNSPGFSGKQTYKDKGLDVKVRLLTESEWLPELSVGLKDFGGTGLFESEYIAASKRFGPFDVHLGLGWGYLGRSGNISNPFCEVSERFCRRPGGFSGSGGKIDYQRFFKGPAALYGGIEYQTPIADLRFKLEYEGNDYSKERAGIIEQDSKVNVAAMYRWGSFDFNINYQRGNTFGFGVSYDTNFNTISQVKFDSKPLAVAADAGVAEQDYRLAKLTSALYAQAGFMVSKVNVTESEAVIQGEQRAFRDEHESIERISRVLANYLPYSVQRYRIVTQSYAMPMVETVVDAAEFKKQVRYETLRPDVRSSYVRKDPQPDRQVWQFEGRGNGLGFGLETFWIQMLGNPEAFFMYQGGVLPHASYYFSPTTAISASAKVTLLENFDKFNFKVDAQKSTLPRVRTYSREYVTRGTATLDTLYFSHMAKLSDSFYAQGYAGYLETMFGGAGGEILYRPLDSRFAIGADINYVRQRDYDTELQFFDYDVITGFINLYYQPEFLDDAMLTMNVGRFLAQDVGVNFDFAKRFDSGIVVGAFAAFTDASAAEYGEGSFTKGFYLSIPFDLMSFKSTKGRGAIPWVPIARDGGQMLNRPALLRTVTEARNPFYK